VFIHESGYQRATQLLNSNQIQHEPTRHYADIWSFCLNSRTTRFYHLSDLESQRADKSKELIIPQAHISPYHLLSPDSQFWFVFDRRLNFNESNFNTDMEVNKTQSASVTNNTVLGRIKFFRGVHVRLSYGALTSMNEYYHHPEYDFPKRTEWTVNRSLDFSYLKIMFAKREMSAIEKLRIFY
jgi:hypothetical protein